MRSYKDNKGNKHFITSEELEIAVDTKIELQKAGNGTCNWSKLCSMLKDQGIDAKKCENFRVLVREYQRALGKLPEGKKYADQLNSHQLDTVRKEIGELNIAKRELQTMRTDFNKLKRYVTDVEISNSKILNLAKQNFNVTIEKHEHDDSLDMNIRESDMIVTLSDLHIGAVTNLNNSHYNSEIAYSYLLEYANQINDMIVMNKPKRVYIANLGDMIEGSFMRYNQQFDIDLNQSEQQAKAIEYVMDFINKIYGYTSNYGVELYYTGIAGNHDRSNGNKKDNISGDSFITVLNAMVKIASEKMDGFTFIEPDDNNRTKLFVRNHWIKLVHGDLDNLNNNSILSNLSQLDGLHYDAVLGGHKHSLMIRENNGLVVQTGSVVGNTNYSKDLAVSASRSQVVMMVTENSLVPVPVPLRLPAVLKKHS